MAEMTIRLVSNPKTGKRDIYIDYESEDDALPHEHESDHKDILEQLLGQGILSGDDVGNIRVGRVQPQAARQGEDQPQDQRTPQGEGQ